VIYAELIRASLRSVIATLVAFICFQVLFPISAGLVAAVAVPAWEPNRKHITAPGKRRPFHTFAVRSSSGSPFGAALQAR